MPVHARFNSNYLVTSKCPALCLCVAGWTDYQLFRGVNLARGRSSYSKDVVHSVFRKVFRKIQPLAIPRFMCHVAAVVRYLYRLSTRSCLFPHLPSSSSIGREVQKLTV